MEQHDELRPLAQHPGYDALKEFAEPINIVEITNIDVSGASDFPDGVKADGHGSR
jgi:hypothetical protein